jgi:hypothetical protein
MTGWSEAEASLPTRITQIDVGGQTVLMEVTVLGGEEEVAGGPLSFEGVGATIEALSANLAEALKKARPTKASLEFGCEVAVEGGHLTALIVKGSGKATLKVTLEWSNPPANAM